MGTHEGKTNGETWVHHLKERAVGDTILKQYDDTKADVDVGRKRPGRRGKVCMASDMQNDDDEKAEGFRVE